MRLRSICTAMPVLLWSAAALPQESAQVIACDTLLAVRRIDAAPGPRPEPAAEPGCRRIARAAVGTVEQRAMIGGAPYECLTVAGFARCVWVVP